MKREYRTPTTATPTKTTTVFEQHTNYAQAHYAHATDVNSDAEEIVERKRDAKKRETQHNGNTFRLFNGIECELADGATAAAARFHHTERNICVFSERLKFFPNVKRVYERAWHGALK